MPSALLGLEAKLYLLVEDEWVEVGNVRDLTINLTKGEADVTVRANDGWRATRGTLKEATIDFQMVFDPEDELFEAFQDAFFSNGSVEIQALTGDLLPTYGISVD